MKPGQGERPEGPRGPQVSSTAPAALRKPISERARSRWPNRQMLQWQQAGGGEWDKVKAIGSGSASSRLASQKPVDRPVS